jgi:hypothetical protein
MVRIALGTSLLMFLSALWLAGCAHPTPPVYHGSQVVITVHPWKTQGRPPDAIQLVHRLPDPTHYVYVGRVKGTAATTELVEAARQAHADLKQHAAALGADVVKIDILRTPAEGLHGNRVLLAGRAYRRLD